MTNNNERPTELLRRAQASDYSRQQVPPLTWADVFMMMFAGVVATLVVAFVMGEI